MMHTFGKENEFEIKYSTFREIYKDNVEIQREISERSEFECDGEVQFIVKGKNLFGVNCKNDKTFTTYTGSILTLIEFFCRHLYFQITDDPFPKKTIGQIGIDMMDEMQLIGGIDNDVLKYADIDFDKIDMELHSKADQWGWRHGFIGNEGLADLPNAYMRKVNDNQIEVSWDSTTPNQVSVGSYYFMHGRGVEYVDLKLYKDTIVAFCLDGFERLGRYFPRSLTEFKTELQKAIDVKV